MHVLCEVESYFDAEQDQSMYKVSKPIQIFATEAEAVAAEEIFNPFYGYELRVVASENLDKTFR